LSELFGEVMGRFSLRPALNVFTGNLGSSFDLFKFYVGCCDRIDLKYYPESMPQIIHIKFSGFNFSLAYSGKMSVSGVGDVVSAERALRKLYRSFLKNYENQKQSARLVAQS